MATRPSEKLVGFLDDKEGFVGKAYMDQGGVLTIGYGFTNLSTVFSSYWQSTRGHKLQKGDTLTKTEAGTILLKLLDAEYAPPVNKLLPDNCPQNQFDGAESVCYNAGAGSLSDQWAKQLAAGNVSLAAELLKTTRITARGKPSAGLRRRREAEARLIELGDYGNGVVRKPSSVSQDPVEVKTYQSQLKSLGYYKGEIDGVYTDPDNITAPLTQAIRKFQNDNKLEVDGKVGPATRATLARQVTNAVGGVGTVVGGTVGGGSQAPDMINTGNPSHALGTGIVVAVVIVVVFILWQFRGAIFKFRTPSP